MSQWRVGGRLNVRSTWPHSHSLMQACVWPLSLSPSNSVCLYPSVSSFSLCLRCTCHLVWLHICGYPVYKAWTAAAFVQRLFALSGTCHGLIHFTHAKEASPLTVSTVKHRLLTHLCPQAEMLGNTKVLSTEEEHLQTCQRPVELQNTHSLQCQTIANERNVPATIEKGESCVWRRSKNAAQS